MNLQYLPQQRKKSGNVFSLCLMDLHFILHLSVRSPLLVLVDTFQSTTGTSSPNSIGRKRGQTFSVMQMTDAAKRLPISQDSASVLP